MPSPVLERRAGLWAIAFALSFAGFAQDARAAAPPLDRDRCLSAVFSGADLEDLLAQAPLVLVGTLENGSTRPLKLRFAEQNVMGVFKKATAALNPGKEVAVYRIDRLLGLGLVPLTVLRSFQGARGSFQLFVEGENPYLSMAAPTADMNFLDMFIANTDRTAENYLVTPDQSQAALDHEKSLETLGHLPPEWVFRRSLPRPEVYARFLALTPGILHHELDEFLGSSKVDELVQQRELILRYRSSLGI